MDDRQVDYLSTLSVSVTAYDTTSGSVIERRSVPRLRLYWASLMAAPTLMDEDTARWLAPGGLVSETMRAESTVDLEELGYVYEVAPQ